MSAPRIYLDHAATTPLLPQARAAMARGFDMWANPSSPHAAGRAARAALEDARARIKAALGWDGEVIFTSGASEALAIAIGRCALPLAAVSAVEHDAVLRHAYSSPAGEGDRPKGGGGGSRRDAAPAGTPPPSAARASATSPSRGGILPVDARGLVDPAACALPGLVAVQHANNETGVIQPLAEVAAAVRGAGGLLLADCAQTAGKLALPDADLIAISAHKFGGPIGIGALLVRDFAMLRPSGGQERGYRAGTENLPGALGMAAALEAGRGWLDAAADLRRRLDDAITAASGEVLAAGTARIATIAGYRMPGVSAAAQLIRFDGMGLAVSAGSACSSGSLKTSHVLAAMAHGSRGGCASHPGEHRARDLASRHRRVPRRMDTGRAVGQGRGMIYLDNQATTPLAPEARDAMLPWLSGPEAYGFANPHSTHKAGRAAAAAVEVAREQVASLLPARRPGDLHQRRDRGAEPGGAQRAERRHRMFRNRAFGRARIRPGERRGGAGAAGRRRWPGRSGRGIRRQAPGSSR